MEFTTEKWFTIKVGQKQASRKFKGKWSWEEQDYMFPPSEFRKVAAELGAKPTDNFDIFNLLN
jgi:hypothetical protein